MPTFSFAGNELGPPVAAVVAEGGALIDVCDDAGAPVAFSCRSSSCGTCRVEVLEGAALLYPPAGEELEVLEIFASPPGHRLACQAVARSGAGAIVLRWVKD